MVLMKIFAVINIALHREQYGAAVMQNCRQAKSMDVPGIVGTFPEPRSIFIHGSLKENCQCKTIGQRRLRANDEGIEQLLHLGD